MPYPCHAVPFLPRPNEFPQKANLRSINIQLPFNISRNPYGGIIDIIGMGIWGIFAEDLCKLSWAKELYISFINLNPPRAFNGELLDDEKLVDLLTGGIGPQLCEITHLEKFEVQVNWKMEPPPGFPFTLRVVGRKDVPQTTVDDPSTTSSLFIWADEPKGLCLYSLAG